MSDVLKLPLEFDAEALAQDLARVEPSEWIHHYNPADYEGDWQIAAVRSLGGRSDMIFAASVPSGFELTEMGRRCRYFQEVLAALECDQQSARLMKLGPGAEIKEHCDSAVTFADGHARLHIPVVTSPEVEFVLNGKQIVMNPGECWYLDFGRPHRVANRGQMDRVHLVIDCLVNDWLREVFRISGDSKEASS